LIVIAIAPLTDVHQSFAPMSGNGMDRPCSRQTREHTCGGNQEEEQVMPRKFDTAVVTIGIDPGKNTLHLVGLDARGEIVQREKVARSKIVSRLANLPPCEVCELDLKNGRTVSPSRS
jgi:hypothetical protein